MMKKFLCALIAIFMLFSLCACGGVLFGGNTKDVEIVKWQPSSIYTDEEIKDAIDTVKDYFEAEFDGCTLTEITYAGDEEKTSFEAWAKQYNADEGIVLYSSFTVDSSGGDGSLNPNSTYDNWSWILTRNDGGKWEHKTHGYG